MNSEAMDGSGEDKKLVDALRRSRLFRGYERDFTAATGLALTLRPVDFWQLAHHGKKHENAFCALLAENPKTLAVCLRAHDEMVRHTQERPHSVTCPFGLTESAVPVRLGERTIGFLRIGQVLRRSSDHSDMIKLGETLSRYGAALSSELQEAWSRSPLIPPPKYNAIVRLLQYFAAQLSALCNQLLTEQQASEPVIVTKARAYIALHQHEHLDLAAVARAAGVSVFHFCKIFRRTTGLTFTDYLARVRAEKARLELLKPNRRVSEIAYEVGFESLTQFNRVFKRVFGQSPTQIRQQAGANKK